jgi:hypothetical protein
LSQILSQFVTKYLKIMAENIEIKILAKVKKAKRGSLFFSENFMTIGQADAIRKALERLVKSGELSRVAAGLYVRPELDPVIGPVSPSIDAIAKAIAKRDKARIVPTGDYALNRLGLTTQIPMKVVYLTDGAARKIQIGKQSITFKKATPKNVAALGELSRLAIQALRTIGEKNVTLEKIEKIRNILKKEKKNLLQHDMKLAPAWIREIIRSVLNESML